jgi:Putative lumazine-binding
MKNNDAQSLRNARRQMSQPNASLKIVAIDMTGDVATARKETEYLINAPAHVTPEPAERGAKLTEYLSLIRFDGGWKIVSRVYSSEARVNVKKIQT